MSDGGGSWPHADRGTHRPPQLIQKVPVKQKHGRRLDKVAQRIGSLPIDHEVVKQAYAVFQATGELPDRMRLAYAVVKRAKAGVEMSDLFASTNDFGTLIQAQLAAPKRPDDPVMDALYDEAVCAKGMVRDAARQVLRGLASAKFDPTQPQFVGTGIELPEYGGAGLDLLGIPQRLAKRPFVQQAARLFRRIAELRERIPQDRRWFDQVGDATQRFQFDGELPTSEMMCEAILVASELHTLIDHARGEDVSQLMAAFDAVAQATAEGRAPAIERLQDLVRAEGMRAREDHEQPQPDPRSE